MGLIALAAAGLFGCPGGGPGGGSSPVDTCDDPSISGTPDTTATVGVEYRYSPTVRYTRAPGFTGTGYDVVEAPAGADGLAWTPTAAQANTSQHFKIETREDYCGDSAHQSWDVWVYPAPPKVTATDPANGAYGVALDTLVSATFGEPMDPATVDASTFLFFVYKDSVLAPLSGGVTYSGTTATFKPDADLELGNTYTAKITTGAKSLAGGVLAQDYVWIFSTPLPPDGDRAVVIPTDGWLQDELGPLSLAYPDLQGWADLYRITLPSKGTLYVTMLSGSSLDPRLEVRGAAVLQIPRIADWGIQYLLAADDNSAGGPPGTNAEITIDLEAGEYVIVAGGKWGQTGGYYLSTQFMDDWRSSNR